MHNCSTQIPNLKDNYYTIEKNMVDTFYAMYMARQYGIEIGYKTTPWSIVCMRFELALWQLNNDCGALCELSKQQ